MKRESPSFGGLFDIDAKREAIMEMESIMAQPGFWDDSGTSREIIKKRTTLEKVVQLWDGLVRQTEDARVMIELGEEAQDAETLTEVHGMAVRLMEAVGAAEFQRMLCGPHDRNSCFITINPGAGGTESQDWAEMLQRMYLRWAEKRGFKAEILDESRGEEVGIKNVTISITGSYAFGYLKSEHGVHRLVRLSPFDSDHARHTSFVLIEVMPEAEENVDVKIAPEDIKVDTFRSSGAGGQNVQKVSSAVRITHLPTGIVVTCQTERSQLQNKAIAIKILYSRILEMELEKHQQPYQ